MLLSSITRSVYRTAHLRSGLFRSMNCLKFSSPLRSDFSTQSNVLKANQFLLHSRIYPRSRWLPAATLRNNILLSTLSSPKSPIKNQAQFQFQSINWKAIARAIYYFRIPVLVLSVYGIGYQQGIMDYSRDPKKMESNLLDTILAGVGCTSPEEKECVLIAYEGEWKTMLSSFRAHYHGHEYETQYQRMVLLRNVAIVGEKIVKVAQNYVRSKLKEAVMEATSNMPPEVLENEARLYHALELNDNVEDWTKARRHMEGPWKFVLIPSPVPNAFVSEILPHRIFITTSLLNSVIENEDELALVLAHEISHLILGHSSERNHLETAFRTFEILLLSLDPTEGFLSIAFMSSLAYLRLAIGAFHSRDNEREADELGIKLAAMACYDTRTGSHVFRKMHLQDIESGKEVSSSRVGMGGLVSIFDSHPPSEERYHSLLEQSKEENRGKYEDTSCATLKDIFWEVMKSDTGK